MAILPRALLWGAAALMVADAIGYSVGAVASIQRAVAPNDPYWKRRLLLNLLLANQGLYFAGIAAVFGAIYIDTQPRAAQSIEVLCFLTCAYTVATVVTLTPKDWPHVLPRAMAAVLILAAWITR